MNTDINEKVLESKPEDAIPALSLSPEQTALFREMIAAGVSSGRKKSKTNPQMDRFIFTYIKGVAVFDVAQTVELIDKAAAFLKELVAQKQMVLAVGSQPAARELVHEFAKKHEFPYVTSRWLGGTLTNFKTISQRIEYFKQLKADKASGALEKYTKKERLELDRLMEKMAFSFTGVETMTQLPAAVFVVDGLAHETAVREARRLNIPLIAIMNNDSDPTGIAYPIPANDNTRSSLSWIFDRIERGLV